MCHYERAGVISLKCVSVCKPDLVEEVEAACEYRSGWAVHTAVETCHIRVSTHLFTSGVSLTNE